MENLAVCLSPSFVAFVHEWLPNLIATVIGCGLSYWFGRRQGRVAERALGNVLEALAPGLGLSVVRDEKGRITGQLNRTIQVPPAPIAVQGQDAGLHVGNVGDPPA